MLFRSERLKLSKRNATLTVSAGNGNLIEHLNSHPPNFWTEAIPGDKVLLKLVSDDKVHDWEFEIKKVECSVDTDKR